MEISGHIDIDMRMKTENILPYLNGERKLVPNKSDLTYYNWDRGTAAYNSTPGPCARVPNRMRSGRGAFGSEAMRCT